MSLKDWLTKSIAVTVQDDPDPRLRPRRYRENADALLQAVRDAALDLSGWDLLESREVQGRVHLTHRSLLPGSVQDVNVYIVRGQDGVTRLEAVSQSRSNRGDLGQNRRNLISLLTSLDRRHPALPD